MSRHTDRTMAARIAWEDVEIWSGDGSWEGPASYARPASSKPNVTGSAPFVARKLREYRDTGGIWGCFLADPEDFVDDENGLVDAGPKVSEINWTGLS